jgi:hypothetical protein
LGKVDFAEGASPKVIRIQRDQALVGDLSGQFKVSQPFKWLGSQ